MKIWLRINGLQRCSWTIVWNHLRRAFGHIGCDIPLNPFQPPPDDDIIEMWWCDPKHWDWSGLRRVKCKVGIALSEARSILKEGRQDVIDNINECDFLICPSQHATTAFKEAPIDVPIHIIPFGVDDTQYHYIQRDWTGTLRFLHLGNAQFRKGSWLVPEAFIAAFRKTDAVHLTIACFLGNSTMYAELEREYGRHPQITFTTRVAKSPIEYYRDHHIIVSPHLSERFGLIPFEGMATGMAGMVARCSSPSEFFTDEHGWWINMSEEYAPVSRCLPKTAGYWRVPDVHSLASIMRYANGQRMEAQRKGQVASAYVLANLTWRGMTGEVLKLLAEYGIIISQDGGKVAELEKAASC